MIKIYYIVTFKSIFSAYLSFSYITYMFFLKNHYIKCEFHGLETLFILLFSHKMEIAMNNYILAYHKSTYNVLRKSGLKYFLDFNISNICNPNNDHF